MSFSYKPLWKLLIDRDMSKVQLMKKANISQSTMYKMNCGKQVSMDVIDRICSRLHCRIEDVIEHVNDED